jgi:hypothetical protein
MTLTAFDSPSAAAQCSFVKNLTVVALTNAIAFSKFFYFDLRWEK